MLVFVQAALGSCMIVPAPARPTVVTATVGPTGALYASESSVLRLWGPDGDLVPLQVSTLRTQRRFEPKHPLKPGSYTVDRWDEEAWVPFETLEISGRSPVLPPLEVTWTHSPGAVTAEVDVGPTAVLVGFEVDGVGEVALVRPMTAAPYVMARHPECGVAFTLGPTDRVRVVVHGSGGGRAESPWTPGPMRTPPDPAHPRWLPLDLEIPDGPVHTGRCGELVPGPATRGAATAGDASFKRADDGAFRLVRIGAGALHIDGSVFPVDTEGWIRELYGTEQDWMVVVEQALLPVRYHVPGRRRHPPSPGPENRLTLLRVRGEQLVEKHVLTADSFWLERSPAGLVVHDGIQDRIYDAPAGSSPSFTPVLVPEGQARLAAGYLWVEGRDGLDSLRVAVPPGAVIEPHGDRVRLRYVDGEQEVAQTWRCGP